MQEFQPIPLKDMAALSQSFDALGPENSIKNPYSDLNMQTKPIDHNEEQLQLMIDKLRKRKDDELKIKKRKEALKEQRNSQALKSNFGGNVTSIESGGSAMNSRIAFA